jgi:bacillithiol system protein YtxJ
LISLTSLTRITSKEQLEQAIRESYQQPVLLLKHSTACPISRAAHEEVATFCREFGEPLSAYVVYVIEDRPISNEIAEMFSVQHQSPQAFLLKDGSVKWHASHWNITREEIKQQIP